MTRIAFLPFCRVLFFTLPWCGILGCEKEGKESKPLVLATATEEAATRLTNDFLSAIQDKNIDAALAHLCEQDALSQQNARDFLRLSQTRSSPFYFESFKASSALAHWVGREPYYWVDASFVVGKRFFFRSYRVRVRDGCIEHFLVPHDGGPMSESSPSNPQSSEAD